MGHRSIESVTDDLGGGGNGSSEGSNSASEGEKKQPKLKSLKDVFSGTAANEQAKSTTKAKEGYKL